MPRLELDAGGRRREVAGEDPGEQWLLDEIEDATGQAIDDMMRTLGRVTDTLLVGFSRLAVAVHYPSDVIAAWPWVLGWIVLVWPRSSRRALASWRETRRA